MVADKYRIQVNGRRFTIQPTMCGTFYHEEGVDMRGEFRNVSYEAAFDEDIKLLMDRCYRKQGYL